MNITTHRAVGPVKHPAGEVGGMAHHPRNILGQVCVKVGATGPQSEPWAGPVLLQALHSVLLCPMVNIPHPVVTRGYEAL